VVPTRVVQLEGGSLVNNNNNKKENSTTMDSEEELEDDNDNRGITSIIASNEMLKVGLKIGGYKNCREKKYRLID
jgi:hypothetical protein